MSDFDWQKDVLVYLTGTLTSGLGVALDEICKMKGEAANAWLDDFESRMARDVKNIVTEGVAMTDETRGTEAALAMLHVIVKEARKKVTPQ
jgi:hypothetical protein